MGKSLKKKYKTLSSRLIFSNPYWDYRKDEYISPNLETTDFHFVDSKGACMIIPVLDNNTFVLVRQYRYLNKRFSVEFPGGGLKRSLSLIENALKELEEESGFTSNSMKVIGEFNPYNGVTNEICSVFIARELIKIKSNPDKTEEFEIICLEEKEIFDRIKSNEIWDGMTLAAWSLFQVTTKERI